VANIDARYIVIFIIHNGSFLNQTVTLVGNTIIIIFLLTFMFNTMLVVAGINAGCSEITADSTQLCYNNDTSDKTISEMSTTLIDSCK
jgi:hypothetical protein